MNQCQNGSFTGTGSRTSGSNEAKPPQALFCNGRNLVTHRFENETQIGQHAPIMSTLPMPNTGNPDFVSPTQESEKLKIFRLLRQGQHHQDLRFSPLELEISGQIRHFLSALKLTEIGEFEHSFRF
jgi:hypothetical protein